jgi:hypothetical protein
VVSSTPGALRGHDMERGQEQERDQEPDGLAWQPVAGAPGLLRAEITKADGRRLTAYRRPGADRR